MIELILGIIIIALILFAFFLFKKASALEEEISDLSFRKASQSVKYGKITEQFLPLADVFPYDKENFRFIGSPIDGLAFNTDEVVFCEFKAASSTLSKKQRHIKELVQNKKVRWEEFNLKEN